MSRKFLIGFAVVALLTCGLTIAGTQGLWKQLVDSTRVNTLAQSIADFALPTGYRADYAVEVLNYTIVAYISDDGQSHLTFVQAPPGVIPDGQIADGYVADDRAATTWSEATPISSDERLVRAQPATLTISDRTNGDGVRYRSLNLIFASRGGTTLLVINQPVAQWDEVAIEAFISSIE
jgi:hypothetical protein